MAPWSPVALPPRFVAARRTRLVGRRYELEVLETVWERVAQGAGQVLLVGGEPGAGKTRLAAEVAGALHEQGAAVLVGTATKDAGVPYQPFVEMLDHLFLASEPGTLADCRRRGTDRAGCPGTPHRHLPATPAEPAGDGRRDLFEAVAELFRSDGPGPAAGRRPRRPALGAAADRRAARARGPLLPGHPDAGAGHLPDHRAGPVGRAQRPAGRPAPARRRAPPRPRRAGHRGHRRVRVPARGCVAGRGAGPGGDPARPDRRQPVLPPRDLARPRTAAAVWRRCAARSGCRSPSATRWRPGWPASAAQLREIVELAAVLGDGFDLPTLVRAGATDRGAEHGRGRRGDRGRPRSKPVDGTPDRYGFVHSLTRQAVLDRLPHTRRTMLHARVAQALEAARRPRADPADRAPLPRGAHPRLPRRRRCGTPSAAARQAVHSLAFEEAALWFDRARDAAGDRGGASGRELSFEAAANHVRAGRLRPGPGDLRAADRRWPTRWCGCRRRWAWRRPTRGPGSPTAAPPTCSARPSPTAGSPRTTRATCARWAASAGRWRSPGGSSEARAVGSRAIEAARRSGDRPTLVHTLKTSLWHGLTPDMAAVQLDRSAELARLCAEPGDRESAAAWRRSSGPSSATWPGGRTTWPRPTTDLRRAAEATGQPWHAYFAGCLAQGRAFLPGRLRAGRAAGRGDPAARGRVRRRTPPTAPTACRCS